MSHFREKNKKFHRLCSEQARFALPEVKVGLAAVAGGLPSFLPCSSTAQRRYSFCFGAQNLQRLIGYHNAMYYAMTGKPISVQEAKALNLVQEVVPHEVSEERREEKITEEKEEKRS